MLSFVYATHWGQKSSIYPKIHIFKFIFHKIHKSEISILTKFTFYKHQILGNFWIKVDFFPSMCSQFKNIRKMYYTAFKCIYLILWIASSSQYCSAQLFLASILVKSLIFHSNVSMLWKLLSNFFLTLLQKLIWTPLVLCAWKTIRHFCNRRQLLIKTGKTAATTTSSLLLANKKVF